MNIREFVALILVWGTLGFVGCGGPEVAPEGSAGKPESVTAPPGDPPPPPAK